MSLLILSPGFKGFVVTSTPPWLLHEELSLNKYPADSVTDEEFGNSWFRGYLKAEREIKEDIDWVAPGERIAFGSTRDSIRPQKQALFTKPEKMSYYTYCEFKCITNVPAEMDGTGKLFT